MVDHQPVDLVEDAESGARFLIYGSESGPRIELRYEGDALWMTQAQMADLFGRDVSVISRHISAIFEDSELDESNMQKMQIATSTKPVAFYSLDMVISVGYRVSSAQATLFRRWATDKLVRFATKGFVIDSVRLKQPDAQDLVAQLRDAIRDIRSDEANVYRELRSICAMCQDYDPKSDGWRDFYQRTQAKLVFAVASSTPSEVIMARANAEAETMGLTSWKGNALRKSDVSVSKNYLGAAEVKELNRLTTIILDIFEDQLELGRLTMMAQAETQLDAQLQNLGRSVLRSGGHVSAERAREHAEGEYDRYKAKLKAARHVEADEAIKAIKLAQKSLPKRLAP